VGQLKAAASMYGSMQWEAVGGHASPSLADNACVESVCQCHSHVNELIDGLHPDSTQKQADTISVSRKKAWRTWAHQQRAALLILAAAAAAGPVPCH
jgi:hypothetical protein